MVGLFLGYIISTLRMSLGDFDFEASMYLTEKENLLFWFIWSLTIIMTCIVFLNFIIAEASASYESVKSRLEAMVFKEKASLIAEVEAIFYEKYKTNEVMPKYLVIRNIET